jgi:hypothetical protein
VRRENSVPSGVVPVAPSVTPIGVRRGPGHVRAGGADTL